MSILIKFCTGRGADEDVANMFAGHHVPDGGSFSIDPSSCTEQHEDYAYLTIFDKNGCTLGSVPIKGNLYVMDNGKTIASFWGGKKYPTQAAYKEMDRLSDLDDSEHPKEEKEVALKG